MARRCHLWALTPRCCPLAESSVGRNLTRPGVLIHKVRGEPQSGRDDRHRVLILPLPMASCQSPREVTHPGSSPLRCALAKLTASLFFPLSAGFLQALWGAALPMPGLCSLNKLLWGEDICPLAPRLHGGGGEGGTHSHHEIHVPLHSQTVLGD